MGVTHGLVSWPLELRRSFGVWKSPVSDKTGGMGIREVGFRMTKWGGKMANKQGVCVYYPVLKVYLASLRVTEHLGNCILLPSQVPLDMQMR